MRVTIIGVLSMLALHMLAEAEPSRAQERSWPEEKCFRYTRAWQSALARRGRIGLSDTFIARHEAFLASGCTAQPDVCPRSAEELAMANVLTILAMNAGTASTFLPFACRKD